MPDFPFTSKVPRLCSLNPSPRQSATARETRRHSPVVLHRPSMRLARFTVSPMTVYYRRLSTPMFPARSWP